MNKKVLSLILALVMVLGTFANVFAAEAKEASKDAKKAENGEKVEKIVGKDNKIQYIIDKKFVEGYEDGSMGYDKNITRAEITRLLVLANGNEDLAKQLQGSLKIYSDVELAHWANGVINVGTTRPSSANGIAMLAGYPDGSFKPDRNVSYAELAKMLVVLVKKDLTADMVKNAKWATSWMTWAAELGILEDVNVADSNAAANRADAFTMLYNALYKMVEFKRVPANEVRGILSELNSGKLQLNQDKEKEYTVNKDTVVVTGKARAQWQRVSSINNVEYWLGSFVRVLINDKKEVTHIIELGNPAEMALDNTGSTAGKIIENNRRWGDIADATVSTEVYAGGANKEISQKVNASYVTVDLNGSKTKATGITFHQLNKDKKDTVLALDIVKDTEIYVANPANNQMRQVKDIVEALSLLGYQNYGMNGYKIFNVYAGFDNDAFKPSIKKFVANSNNTAKVIVFNLVNKDNGLEKFRVVNSTGANFSATLEDTDGKLVDRSFVKDTSAFPFGPANLFDVIGLDNYRSASNIVVYVDHSAYKSDFPIAKVLRVLSNNNIAVVDRFGEEGQLDLRDADIFNAKQYKDLKEGDFVQFLTENKNDRNKTTSKIDVLSILPREEYRKSNIEEKFLNSSSIKGMVPSIQKDTVNGKVISADASAFPYTVKIELQYDNYKYGLYAGVYTFEVGKADAQLIAANVGRNVSFILNKDSKLFAWFAYGFESNDGKALNQAGASDLENSVLYLIDKYKKSGDETANTGDYDVAKAEIAKLGTAQLRDKYTAILEAAKKDIDEAVTATGAAKLPQNGTATEAQINEAQKAVDKLFAGEKKTALQKLIDDAKAANVLAEQKVELTAYQTAITTKLSPTAPATIDADKALNQDVAEAKAKAAVEKLIAEVKPVPAGAKAEVTHVQLNGASSTVEAATATVTVTISSTIPNVAAPKTVTATVTFK